MLKNLSDLGFESKTLLRKSTSESSVCYVSLQKILWVFFLSFFISFLMGIVLT